MLLLFGFVRVQNVRNGGNGWLCRLLHFKIDELYVIFRYAHEITPFHLIQKTRRLDLECNDFSQIQILNNKISLVSSTVGISQNAEFFNIFIYKNASATDAKTNMVKCFSGIFTWNFPPRCISSMVHRSLVISYSNRKSQALFTQHTHTQLIQSFVCFGWQLLVKFRPTNWMLDLLSLSFDDDEDDNNSATTSTIIWTHHTNPDTVHIRNQSVK